MTSATTCKCHLMVDGAWRMADVIWVDGGANTPLRMDRG